MMNNQKGKVNQHKDKKNSLCNPNELQCSMSPYGDERGTLIKCINGVLVDTGLPCTDGDN